MVTIDTCIGETGRNSPIKTIQRDQEIRISIQNDSKENFIELGRSDLYISHDLENIKGLYRFKGIAVSVRPLNPAKFRE